MDLQILTPQAERLFLSFVKFQGDYTRDYNNIAFRIQN